VAGRGTIRPGSVTDRVEAGGSIRSWLKSGLWSRVRVASKVLRRLVLDASVYRAFR
jgi:hypothetical protein